MVAAVRKSRFRFRDQRSLIELPTAVLWKALLPALMALTAVAGLGDDQRSATSESTTPTHTDNDPADAIVRLTPVAAVEATAAAPVPAEIQQLLVRLESAGEFLRKTKSYAATFTQQVHKNGRLLEPQRIQLKVRHEPFSVFMQWEQDGQQALYVSGEHDDKLLVHPTRGLGRLRRLWTLEPDSGLAMKGSLRPVTEIGLLNMVRLLLGFHKEHILNSHCVCQSSAGGKEHQTCYVLTFDSPHQNPYFSKTHLWLCDKQHYPVRIENYSWADENSVGPLLESYDYSDVCLDACVTEADFDRDNKKYSF